METKKQNPKILNDFLDYLRMIKNYSKGTIDGYCLDLLCFFRFLNEYLELNISIKDFNVFILSSVKEDDVIAFLVYLNFTKDNTGVTRQRKLTAIRTFYNWLLDYPSVPMKINPAYAITNLRKVEKIPKYLLLSQAKEICNVFTVENSRKPLRNNTIIYLFLNTGLRLAELCNLNVNDIHFESNYLIVIGKGNKERKVYFSEGVREHLLKYLKIENNCNGKDDLDRPLFISRQGNRISRRAIQVICEDAFELIGLGERGYSTHTLRHTFATIMYQSCNKDILLLKELMRHESIEATQIYTHIDNDEIRKAFESNPLADFECVA